MNVYLVKVYKDSSLQTYWHINASNPGVAANRGMSGISASLSVGQKFIIEIELIAKNQTVREYMREQKLQETREVTA